MGSELFAVPATFLTMHTAYGCGTLAGSAALVARRSRRAEAGAQIAAMTRRERSRRLTGPTPSAGRREGALRAAIEAANLFRLQALERELAAALLAAGLLPWGGQRALDAGCGGGWRLRLLLRWCAAGTRSRAWTRSSAPASARRVHPDLRLIQASADALPFPSGSFDLVSQFTAFSSILTHRAAGGSGGDAARGPARRLGAVVRFHGQSD
jgi:SAM-dependent methyltransferase